MYFGKIGTCRGKERAVRRILILILCLILGCETAQAQFRSWGRAMRKAAKVSDDVPLRELDNFVPDQSLRRNAREALSEGKYLDDVAYMRKLSRSLDELTDLDPATVRALRLADAPTQEMAVLVCRGARHLGDEPLDIMRRVDFLRVADGKTLAALGAHPALVRDALDLDQLIRTGKVVSPKGMRAVTLDDFGNFFHKFGKKGEEIWNTQIRPHWKLWVTGGALAAILLTPEEYLDEAGDWLAEGAAKLAEFGVELVTKPTRAVVETVAETTGEQTQEFFRWCWGFLASWTGVCALIPMLLLVYLICAPFRTIIKKTTQGTLRLFRRMIPRKKLGPDID